MTDELYNSIAFRCLDFWMTNREKGKSIDKYLKSKNVKKIGIYGYGILGKHLVNELINSEIEIVWVMDKKEMCFNNGLKFVQTEAVKNEEKPELVLVTSIRYYEEIEKELIEKGYGNIRSIEEIVEVVNSWDI